MNLKYSLPLLAQGIFLLRLDLERSSKISLAPVSLCFCQNSMTLGLYISIISQLNQGSLVFDASDSKQLKHF